MQLRNNTGRSCVCFTQFIPMVIFVKYYLLLIEWDIEINTVKILNNFITTQIPHVILYSYHLLVLISWKTLVSFSFL